LNPPAAENKFQEQNLDPPKFYLNTIMNKLNKGTLIMKDTTIFFLVEKFRRVLDSVDKFSSSADSKIYT